MEPADRAVERGTCAVISGVQIRCVNVWEEIFVHACKARMTAFSGLLLALSVVCMALGSVIETNTLFYWRQLLFCGDHHP